MALGDLNLLNNLVYGIFGEPLVFSLVLTMIFLYYSIHYDIPKWVNLLFFIPVTLWLSVYYLPTWATILVIIAIGLLTGPRLFRATRP